MSLGSPSSCTLPIYMMLYHLHGSRVNPVVTFRTPAQTAQAKGIRGYNDHNSLLHAREHLCQTSQPVYPGCYRILPKDLNIPTRRRILSTFFHKEYKLGNFQMPFLQNYNLSTLRKKIIQLII